MGGYVIAWCQEMNAFLSIIQVGRNQRHLETCPMVTMGVSAVVAAGRARLLVGIHMCTKLGSKIHGSANSSPVLPPTKRSEFFERNGVDMGLGLL